MDSIGRQDLLTKMRAAPGIIASNPEKWKSGRRKVKLFEFIDKLVLQKCIGQGPGKHSEIF
jgi:hypothetical protein